MSLFHFVTVVNLIGHAELANDFFIRLIVVSIYLIHAFAGVIVVFMFGMMVPLHEAWGCYQPGKGLADLNLGPCGESPDLPWVNPHPQAICRQSYPQSLPVPCEANTDASQFFGPTFSLACHAEAVAVGLYTLGCLHAYSIYFTDLSVMQLPSAKKTSKESNSIMYSLM